MLLLLSAELLSPDVHFPVNKAAVSPGPISISAAVAMLVSALLIATLLRSSHGFTIQLQDDTQAVSEPRTFLADPQSDAYIDMILENLRQVESRKIFNSSSKIFCSS